MDLEELTGDNFREVDCGCDRYCADLDAADDHPQARCRGLPPLGEPERDEDS